MLTSCVFFLVNTWPNAKILTFTDLPLNSSSSITFIFKILSNLSLGSQFFFSLPKFQALFSYLPPPKPSSPSPSSSSSSLSLPPSRTLLYQNVKTPQNPRISGYLEIGNLNFDLFQSLSNHFTSSILINKSRFISPSLSLSVYI